MIKYRYYLDKDKETEWLNQMSKEGYVLTGFAMGFYSFDKCEPGKYSYQIDIGDKNFSVSNEYREFMNEAGIEIVTTWGPWVFLRKPANEGEFELYTDVDSNIEHYTEIRNLFKGVTILEMICFLIELLVGTIGGNPTLGFSAALLIAIFIGIFMKITVHTNKIINQLKERKGEIVEESRYVSMWLCLGLMLNGLALCINEGVSPFLHGVVQGFAIVSMLVGIYETFRKIK